LPKGQEWTAKDTVSRQLVQQSVQRGAGTPVPESGGRRPPCPRRRCRSSPRLVGSQEGPRRPPRRPITLIMPAHAPSPDPTHEDLR